MASSLRARAAALVAAAFAVLPAVALAGPAAAEGSVIAGSTVAGGPVGPPPGTAAGHPDPTVEPDPEPSESPTEPSPSPSESPTPSPTASPSPSPSPSPPQSPSPTTAPPSPSPPPRVAVKVTTSGVTLGMDYWRGRPVATTLSVTVRNTGERTELMVVRYTLPPGLSDRGTPGCAATGDGTHVCAAQRVGAGRHWTLPVRVLVASDAWRAMPLNGSVSVSATVPYRPDAGTATDSEGFAVTFPPGPPAAGLTLSAGEVRFARLDQPTAPLSVRLGNTGVAPAEGLVEVALPEGVSVATLPAGCQPGPERRSRCALGTLAPDSARTLVFLLAATPEARERTPLSGAAFGSLTPRAGAEKRVQLSFRVLAAQLPPETAAPVEPVPVAGTPTGTGGAATARTEERPDGMPIGPLVGLVALATFGALGLAVVSLRRLRDDAATPAPPPL